MIYSWLFPLPVQGLGQNAREHWAARNRIVRAYREEVASEVYRGAKPWEPIERARVTLQARYHHGRGPGKSALTEPGAMRAVGRYRPADPDNVVAACKSLIDALCVGPDFRTSAGVLAGDRARDIELRVLPPQTGVPWAEEGIHVTVEPLDAR